MSGLHRSVMNAIGMNKRENANRRERGVKEFRELGFVSRDQKGSVRQKAKTLVGSLEKLGG